MKFLLEFVSCCGASSVSPAVPTTPPRTEETRAVMPISSARNDPSSRKRENLTGSNSVSAAQWRPSLGAISEDKVVSLVAGRTERTVKSEKKLTGKAGSRARIRFSDYSDNEFRRTPVPMIIPAFSPTAFLF